MGKDISDAKNDLSALKLIAQGLEGNHQQLDAEMRFRNNELVEILSNLADCKQDKKGRTSINAGTIRTGSMANQGPGFSAAGSGLNAQQTMAATSSTLSHENGSAMAGLTGMGAANKAAQGSMLHNVQSMENLHNMTNSNMAITI